MRIVIYLIGVFALAACSFRQPCVEELAGIEPYVESRPDSARTLLSKIDVGRLRSEGCWAYYNLLKTSAEDKDRVRHVSDSVMLRVVAYYQGRDPEKLQWAYYLLGRVYRDLGDSQEAAKAFRKALEADPESRQHGLLGRIYEQLFYLYSYQNAFPEALEMVNNSYQNYKIHNDSIGVAYALRNRARLYDVMTQDVDSMAIFYREAARIAFEAQDPPMAYSTLREWAAMYVQYQRFDDSEHILAQLPEANKQNNGITLKNIADIYRYRQQPDSAYHYYLQALNAEYANSIYLQKKIYQALADLDSVRDGHSAFRYERLASFCADSIRKLEQAETIRDLDYRQTKIEKQELELENAWKWVFICALLLGGSILVGLLLVAWKYLQAYRQNLQEQKAQNAQIQLQWNDDLRALTESEHKLMEVQQHLKQVETSKKEAEYTFHQQKQELEAQNVSLQEQIKGKEEEIADLQKYIENDRQTINGNKVKITELETYLQELETTQQGLKQLLQQKEQELAEEVRQNQQNIEEKKKRQAELQDSDIVLFFNRGENQNDATLTKAKWAALKEAVEQASPGFSARLLKKCTMLSHQELQICYLKKAGLSPKAIADILSLSLQHVSIMRARLYKKLCGQNGKAKEFDDLIIDF